MTGTCQVLPSLAPSSQGPSSIAGYRVKQRLIAGDCTDVYICDTPDGADEVAVKVLSTQASDDPGAARALLYEAETHAELVHPCIVRAVAFGEEHGGPYLVTEYEGGIDLRKILDRTNEDPETAGMAPSLVVHITRRLCAAAGFLHRGGPDRDTQLIHGAIEPSNVVVTESGEVKLLDFGRACPVSTRPPASGERRRQPLGYSLPESSRGDALSSLSDLYAIGAMAVEMLLGRRMLHIATCSATMRGLVADALTSLAAKRYRQSRPLIAVLERALSDAPETRYPSAAALSTVLASFDHLDAEVARRELATLAERAKDGPLSTGESGTRRASIATVPASARAQKAQLLKAQLGDTDFAPLRVKLPDGRIRDDLPFDQIVELLVTRRLSREAQVDWGDGDGFRRASEHELIAANLPSGERPTVLPASAIVPEFLDELSAVSLVAALKWIAKQCATGSLIARADGATPREKTLFFERGVLIATWSNEPTELLGEYLVRENVIDRAELDIALRSRGRFAGQLGAALVHLGFCTEDQVETALRTQALDRAAGLFQWSEGELRFHNGERPPAGYSRVDVTPPQLLMRGLELSRALDMMDRKRDPRLERVYRAVPVVGWVGNWTWPEEVRVLVAALLQPRPLEDAILDAMISSSASWQMLLRAAEVAEMCGLVRVWPPPANEASSSEGDC